MNRFMSWMEKHFTPMMNKVNHNIWIVTLKDSINQAMPLIFLGSIFCILTLPNSLFGMKNWPDFWVPQGWTMGMISLMIAFLLPFNLMEKVKLRRSRFIAGISGLILFAMAISPQLIADETIGFSHSAFGAGGMFIAIVTGVITGLIMKIFGKISLFKEDSAVPDFVRLWFDQLLPSGTIVIGGWIIIQILGFDLYNTVLNFFQPLQGFTETFWGFMAVQLAYTVLYSMGISAWVLTPITTPIMLSAIEANIAGTAANVFTNSFGYAYLYLGGTGCTLALAGLFLFSKSKKLKALGRASIIPSVFNINEPVVFGAIAWNPILMIPMILSTGAVSAMAYIFTRIISFGEIPQILFTFGFCPYPISTWLATEGSMTSVILCVLLFILTIFIWYPFYRLYEKQCVAEEVEIEKMKFDQANVK